MSRLRTRTTSGYKLDHTGSTVATRDFIHDFFYETSYPGSCGCDHTVFKPYNGPWHSPPGAPTFWFGLTPDWIPREFLRYGHYNHFYSLNRDKLPSSTQFGLVQFFAEFDDALGLFTKKFWKQLTYGSLTWGVLPFISEMQSLLSAIANFDAAFASSAKYEDQFDLTVDYQFFDPGAGAQCTIVGKGIGRLTGAVTLPEQQEAQRLLDYLGLHPDIATVWDLVPLSFMIDWFIPVSSLIDSIHSRGWIRSVPFTGWATSNISGTVSWTTAYDGYPMGGASVEYSIFTRGFWSCDLEITNSDPKSLLELKIPSITQLFNTFYIIWLGKRTKL